MLKLNRYSGIENFIKLENNNITMSLGSNTSYTSLEKTLFIKFFPGYLDSLLLVGRSYCED